MCGVQTILLVQLSCQRSSHQRGKSGVEVEAGARPHEREGGRRWRATVGH